MISGPAAAWLAARREDLNGRFERARRRWPKLDPDRFSALLDRTLPPIAGADGATSDLLSALYDLLLLHSGREAFATQPALDRLVREAFPRLRDHLVRRPRLVAELSNAVENGGERGAELVDAFSRLGALVAGPEQLLEAGALAAWRFGEARLRQAVLRVAGRLPKRAALIALGLDAWPDSAAPLALAALAGDAWRLPESALSARTLANLTDAPASRIEQLEAALRAPPPAGAADWRVVGRAGEFAGFGGLFETPPRLLLYGERHRFFAAAGAELFQVDADIYGSCCRRIRQEDIVIEGGGAPGGSPPLCPPIAVAASGALSLAGRSITAPPLAGAWSVAFLAGGALAFAFRHSHRIRIAVPGRPPV